jgi:hypothetical protein
MTRYLAGVCFCLPLETYHILLSAITIVLYIKEIFEKWTRVANKNQNTKSSQVQTSMQVKTAGDD